MRVFVTGATGFIGSAIVQELIGAGHQVVGLARSATAVAALQAAGAEALSGSLDDLASLQQGAREADGVIHTAFVHDFTQFAASCQTDIQAITAMGDALAGSNKPLLITSGIGLLQQGRLGTERDAVDMQSAGQLRAPSEPLTLALADRGVRASIIRLPPSVHGDGDHGFVPALIAIARQQGVSGYIGDGNNHWPAVHRLDAAKLYRLALEQAPAGSVFHGVAEQGIATREIAQVIGQQLNLPVTSVAAERAAEHFTWLAHFFAMDVPASSSLTRSSLGWETSQPTLLQDLQQGHYFD